MARESSFDEARNRKKRRKEKRFVFPSLLLPFPLRSSSLFSRAFSGPTTSANDERRRRARLPRLHREKTLAGEQRGGANARRRKYWVYFEILFRCVGRATLLHAVHRVTHTLLSTSTQLHALLSSLPPSLPLSFSSMLLKNEFLHQNGYRSRDFLVT